MDTGSLFPQELCSRNVLSMWELLPASSGTAHPMGNLEESVVSLGSSAEGRVFGWPSRAQGANRLCWECSAVGLETGAGCRDVLCLHQVESSGVFAPVPRQLRQLQLPYCWVHGVQFLWVPVKCQSWAEEQPQCSQAWKCHQRIRTWL